jgi:hypothetical protein
MKFLLERRGADVEEWVGITIVVVVVVVTAVAVMARATATQAGATTGWINSVPAPAAFP